MFKKTKNIYICTSSFFAFFMSKHSHSSLGEAKSVPVAVPTMNSANLPRVELLNISDIDHLQKSISLKLVFFPKYVRFSCPDLREHFNEGSNIGKFIISAFNKNMIRKCS